MHTYGFQICFLSLACMAIGFSGCSRPEGVVRYAISGSITLPDGKPVPAGEINFEPDSASGNKGPGSLAPIKDGKYSLPADQGVLGGKYVVTIMSYDGVASGDSLVGKPLVKQPHVEKVDLANQTSTRDFKVTTK